MKSFVSTLFILLSVVAFLTSCGGQKPDMNLAETKMLSKAETKIILDSTAIIDIPKGYSLENSEYIANGAKCKTIAAKIKDKDGAIISIQGWASADPQNPCPLPTKDAFKTLPAVIETNAGTCYLLPQDNEAYIRIGDITYRITSTGDINNAKKMIESLSLYDPRENCPTCG